MPYKGNETGLPAAADGLLHPGGGDRGWRARHGSAGRGVDNGDGITTRSTGRCWLVQLQGLLILEVGDESSGGVVEGKGGSNRVGLLRGGRFRRVARHRGTFG